jgi:hypothetical protein
MKNKEKGREMISNISYTSKKKEERKVEIKIPSLKIYPIV